MKEQLARLKLAGGPSKENASLINALEKAVGDADEGSLNRVRGLGQRVEGGQFGERARLILGVPGKHKVGWKATEEGEAEGSGNAGKGDKLVKDFKMGEDDKSVKDGKPDEGNKAGQANEKSVERKGSVKGKSFEEKSTEGKGSKGKKGNGKKNKGKKGKGKGKEAGGEAVEWKEVEWKGKGTEEAEGGEGAGEMEEEKEKMERVEQWLG